jgi:hypothetical protein
MTRSTAALAATLMLCATLGSVALAQAPIEQRRVKFAPGTTATTIKGTLKGDQTIDYLVGARAGQVMTVKLTPSNASNYFNVMPPGSQGAADFIGSSEGNEFKGTLTADGDQVVRVYLMRNAARRNETSNYTLTIGVAAAVRTGDAKVKGTPYHATGSVRCSRGSAAALSSACDFGVVRGAPGSADVHVKVPGGGERVLTFKGNVVSTTAASGPSTAVKASHSGDEWTIDVGDEHYLIPDAVINGG